MVYMPHKINELIKLYESKEDMINKRLQEFSKFLDGATDKEIFAELAFCICTPQSKAITCWNAIQSLTKNNLLFTGTKKEIQPFLNAIRFNENKANYIVEMRKKILEDANLKLKDLILKFGKNPHYLREWLIKNVKGFGLKEASHFIRNIGLNNNQLAILDVHILKNLHELGVIEHIPKSLSKAKYLEIENKMKKFAEKIGITLDELDLLLWSKETGLIFK